MTIEFEGEEGATLAERHLFLQGLCEVGEVWFGAVCVFVFNKSVW
jgi:hypothetical protein